MDASRLHGLLSVIATGAVVEWRLLCVPYYSISREGEQVVCLCPCG